MLKGIDVSVFQNKIDWKKVKEETDFAILRCGYGDNYTSQDDKQYARNIAECESLGIPYGIYLYSYVDSEAHLKSEIDHTLRLVKGHKPFCVYLDLEEPYLISQGKKSLTNYALRWCKAITDAGYKAGVYASSSWFDRYVDIYQIYNAGYSIWVAQYYHTAPKWNGINYDIWQYASDSTIAGIKGNVDKNYMYNNILNNSKPTPSKPAEATKVIYQIWDDVLKRWLPNVTNREDYAGIYGHDVDCVYIHSNCGDVEYQVHYLGGKWLPKVKNREDYAGMYNKPIDGISIRLFNGSKKLKYRVHLRNGKWLPTVTGCNIYDDNNGYAGIIGKPIDAIEIWIE